MRKTIFVFISFFSLFSCTTENELVYQKHSTTVPVVNKRSLAEALEIAQEAISLLGTQQSRSGDIRTVDMKNVQYLSSNKNSRSQNDDTLLYVINYVDNKGFAVVSANPNTEGLIAVTEKGTYSSTSLTDFLGSSALAISTNMCDKSTNIKNFNMRFIVLYLGLFDYCKNKGQQ